MVNLATNFSLLFESDMSVRVFLTMLHFLWQGAFLGAIAVISGQWLQNASSRTRYRLYSVVLASLPVCAAFTFSVIDTPSSPQASVNTMESSQVALWKTNSSTNEIFDQNIGSSNLVATAHGTLVSTSVSDLLFCAAPSVAVIYMAGALFFFMRLLAALAGGHQLRSRGIPITDPAFLKLISEQADSINLKTIPVVAYCERIAVPTVVGVWCPTVLLPVSLMTGLTPNDLAVIMRHEFAHIRRADLWMNLIQRIIESFLFFHPAVWIISRRLSAERELCCDDLVVSSGYEPVSYAGALLRMAEQCAGGKQALSLGLAAAGESPTLLEARIKRLINREDRRRFQLTRRGMTGLLVALSSLVVVPGMTHRWSHAQLAGDMATEDRPLETIEPIKPRFLEPEKRAALHQTVATEKAIGELTTVNVLPTTPNTDPTNPTLLFDNDAATFGSDVNLFGNDADLFGSDADLFGNDTDPFGNDADLFGNDADLFGNDADPFGNDADPFGNDADLFGNDADPFGSDADPFGAGDQDPFAATQGADKPTLKRRPMAQRISQGKAEPQAEQNQSARRVAEAFADKTSLKFTDTPLQTAAQQLAEAHEIPIVVNRRAMEEVGMSPDVTVTLALHNVSLQSALRLMLRTLKMTYVLKDNVLHITTIEDMRRTPIAKKYRVDDLPFVGANLANSLQRILDAKTQVGDAKPVVEFLAGKGDGPGLLVVEANDVSQQEVQSKLHWLRNQ